MLKKELKNFKTMQETLKKGQDLNRLDIEKLKQDQKEFSERLERYREISKYEYANLLRVTELLEKEIQRRF